MMVLNLCVCYWVKDSRILAGQHHRVGVCSHGYQLLIVFGKSGPYLGGATWRPVCSHGGFHTRLLASTDATLCIFDWFDYWQVTFLFMNLLSFYYRRWWDCCVCALIILQLQYVGWLWRVTSSRILAGQHDIVLAAMVVDLWSFWVCSYAGLILIFLFTLA